MYHDYNKSNYLGLFIGQIFIIETYGVYKEHTYENTQKWKERIQKRFIK